MRIIGSEKIIKLIIILIVFGVTLTLIFNVNTRSIGWITSKQIESPVFMLSDGHIRHCITEEKLGRVPSPVQFHEFVPIHFGNPESPINRVQSFQKVFKDRAWGKFSDEKEALSASGPGSTLFFAQEIMGVLHKVITDIKLMKGGDATIRLLDVPCGDFAWMSRFLSIREDVNYTGMDIVPEIIQHHKKTYINKNWNFVNQDIAVAQSIENYDIILCRMMLQHLLIPDAMRILSIFSNNSDGILITTTFSKSSSNAELNSAAAGRVRQLNLELPPFSLMPPLCVTKDGPPGYLQEIIAIWKLPLQKVVNCTSAKRFKVARFNADFHSCLNWIQ